MSKQVTIKRLALANFKGLRNVAIDFGTEATTISGRNGTGKTTVMDAFCWLLWGKDSEGREDKGKAGFGIKTNDAEGNYIPDLLHEVTGTFDVLDTDTGAVETVELRRVYSEDWRTEAGTTERKLDGHHTDYYWNGVPLKTKTEYEAKVAAIIPEAIFKLITDPYAFLSLDWKVQRETLLNIVGNVTPESVAAGNAQFVELLKNLTGKKLDEYRREVAAKKAKITKRLDKIPNEISAITGVTPEAPDYAAAEAKKAELEQQLADIDAAAASAAEANRVAYEQAASIQAQINDRRTRQQTALHEAETAAREAAYKKNEAYREAQSHLHEVEGRERAEASQYGTVANSHKAAISQCEIVIVDYRNQQDALRKDWFKLNETEFTQGETLTCPLFRTVCRDPEAIARYQADRDEAARKFNEDKATKLAAITEQGKALAGKIAEQEAKIAEHRAALDTEEKRHAEAVESLRKDRAAYEAALTLNPTVATDVKIDPATLPAWAQLQAEIDQLTATLPQATGTAQTDTAGLRIKKADLSGQLDEVKKTLNLRETIERNEAAVAVLRKEGETLAAEKAALQTEEAVIDAFEKAQMDEVESRINRYFANVSFRMFKPLVNGGQEPTCMAYVGGVRYSDLNNAGRINAGLDVVNTLCAFYKVNAPIFVDNAESVNTFIPVTSQLVKLVVTTEDFKVEQV